MAEIVNSWNTWDPLNHGVVGRREGTNTAAPEPAQLGQSGRFVNRIWFLAESDTSDCE